MSDADYWRFCDIVERTRVTAPTVTSEPTVEKMVLEQHTGTGAYRLRPLEEVVGEATNGQADDGSR